MQPSENLEVHVLGALLIDAVATTFVEPCLFSSNIHAPSSLSFMNEEDSGSDSDSSPKKPCGLDGIMPKAMPRSPASDSDDGQAPYPDQLVREVLPSSPPDKNILQNTGEELVEKAKGQPNGDGFSSCGGTYDMILFDQFEIGSNGSARTEHSCIIVESVVVEDECAVGEM